MSLGRVVDLLCLGVGCWSGSQGFCFSPGRLQLGLRGIEPLLRNEDEDTTAFN
jgi:hypothetical protein